jgi:hypothetical protein
VAGALAGAWGDGMPVEDPQAFSRRTASLTLDEVNAVVRKYAKPDSAFFLLSGDRETIVRQIRGLGLGEPVVLP